MAMSENSCFGGQSLVGSRLLLAPSGQELRVLVSVLHCPGPCSEKDSLDLEPRMTQPTVGSRLGNTCLRQLDHLGSGPVQMSWTVGQINLCTTCRVLSCTGRAFHLLPELFEKKGCAGSRELTLPERIYFAAAVYPSFTYLFIGGGSGERENYLPSAVLLLKGPQ